MSEFNLNLSTQPFPRYRVTKLLLGSILIVLVSVSVWQVVGFLRFSSRAGNIRAEVQDALVESEALGRHVAELQTTLDRPEVAAEMNGIAFLNELISRKSLSWTRIFAALEEIVPGTVYLVSLTPSIESNGSVRLQVDLRGRNIAEVSRFIEMLETSEAFDDVAVSIEQKNDPSPTGEVDVALTVNYFPEGAQP